MSAPVDVLAVLARHASLADEVACREQQAEAHAIFDAVAELIEAGRGVLADYEDEHGEGACDCMPEPENVGHVCNACLMRAALARVSGGGK